MVHSNIKLVCSYQIIVASIASDLLFKTIIFHVTPYGPQVFTQGFSDGGGGGAMTLDLKKFTKPGFKQRQFYFFNACDTRYGTKLLVSVIKAKFAINYIME